MLRCVQTATRMPLRGHAAVTAEPEEREQMASATTTKWQFSGEYFENCNCDIVCPCLFSVNAPMTSQPTAGACEVAFGFHVDRGPYGDVNLDGLNAAIMARTPGAMAAGDWSVALYLDERADEAQRQALQTIFTGPGGRVMGALAPLISTVLGVKAAAITFHQDGRKRSLEISWTWLTWPSMRSRASCPTRRSGPPTRILSNRRVSRWPSATPEAPGKTTACAGTTPARTRTMRHQLVQLLTRLDLALIA